MFTLFPLLSALLLILPGSVPTHPATILKPVADSGVRADLDVRLNDNYGCLYVMTVGGSRGGLGSAWGDPDFERAMLRFDLAGESTPVSQALLEFTVSGFTNDAGSPPINIITLHAILDSWEEGDGNEWLPGFISCPNVDDAEGVAWLGDGDGGDANNQTQPAFDAAVAATLNLDPLLLSGGDVVQADITDLVNQWINGLPNHGVVLRDASSGGGMRMVTGLMTREAQAFASGSSVWPLYEQGPRLILQRPVATEHSTWSHVKSLFR